MSLAAHVNFAKLFRIEQILAEEEGFEPPCTFRRKRFSRPPVSTTHPFLRLLSYRKKPVVAAAVGASYTEGEPRIMQDYVEQRDGGYYVAGTRIGLDSIVLAFKDGESPETILRSFPLAGPLVRVYGAIVFYLENKEKVEAYLTDQERLWAEVKTMETELPGALSARLHEAREHAARNQSVCGSAHSMPS
jgi:uncharacterized protein (DUF433 family)